MDAVVGTRILLVDDEPLVLAALAEVVRMLGHEAVTAEGGNNAIERLAHGSFDLCFTDLCMPQTNGLGVIAAAQAQDPPVPVVVLTGRATVKDAIAALRSGACDFLSKPFHPSAIEEIIARLLQDRGPGRSAARTPQAALIGEHPAIRLVLERIEQVADTDASVLIRGETGTGKEIAARLIHTSSSRRAQPFVAVNMAALPESLAESELFGHTRGAFTGADQSRRGKILSAQGGTLFLDEVGDIPKALQAKLLRFLQERQIQPVGGAAPVDVDVRLIAATHRNLEEMVRVGEFREDLFYRLDVIPIDMPPLRERREDVPLLAEHFRRELNARIGRSVAGFSPDVLMRLCAFDWPGNVRQLENTIERLVLLANNRFVNVDDLPPSLRGDVVDENVGLLDLPPSGVDLRSLLTQLEDRFISQALQRTGGNKNRAAELLGMNRTTLVEKLRRRSVA